MLLRQPGPTLFPYTTLFRSTGNKLFIQMSHVITQYFFASTHIHLSPEEYERATCEHRKILNAIETNDGEDRKSTRLNSSHVAISYADFCLKKKRRRKRTKKY